MNKIERFQNCINFALSELGEGLIVSDIYSNEGLPIIDGYNSNPKATALFSNLTEVLKSNVKISNFPNLGDYYIISLENGFIDIVILNNNFQWNLLIDTGKIKLGYLFSIFLNKAIKKFKEVTTFA
jgi:hypothetical protein